MQLPPKPIKLDELNSKNIKLGDLQRLPSMTGWFEPLLLLKLLLRVIVSDLFGQYADRRLIEAALDPVPRDVHVSRATEIPIEHDESGAIWVDYVSDLGDGFDSTYAVASLLAQPELKIGETQLRRGGVLIMGGDEVYPTALRKDYKVKMRLPYELAWPVQKGQPTTPLFALPGNHDWYDGLVNFLAVFSREKGVQIGGWKTRQRRSYFAVRLSDDWWIWGIDIALVRDMDQPQADYFEAIAEAMKQNSSIILCSAEPGWYAAESQSDSYKSLSYAALLAKRANKDLRIPVVLSGDSHHYARYSGDGSQYITSGGGGAFLHGTLELKEKIVAEWLQSPKEELKLEACYPTKEESRELLSGNLNFASLNSGLSQLIAALYVAATFLLTYVLRLDVAFFIFLIFAAGIWGYSRYQEKNARKTVVPSLLHATSHFGVILAFTWVAFWLDKITGGYLYLYWPLWLLTLAIPGMILGSVIGGRIFGWSLELGCKYFDISHNDAFSAMRLAKHRHFIRLRIQNREVTVYPIKIEEVPDRDDWRDNPARNGNPTAPIFDTVVPLKPGLIEEPIVVKAHEASSTSEIKNPGETTGSTR